MIDLQPLAGVAILNLAAAVSPGPAFVLITQTAASSKREVALSAAAGTVAASLIWAAAALLGWQLLLAKAAGLYRFLQIAGGLYLCFLGWSSWRHSKDPLPELNSTGTSPGTGFRKGLLLGLSNPKVIVFFGTIFTTLFLPQTPPLVRWASLFVILINESVWYGTVAAVFGTARVQHTYRRIKLVAERFFGCFLIAFGGRLAWNGAHR